MHRGSHLSILTVAELGRLFSSCLKAVSQILQKLTKIYIWIIIDIEGHHVWAFNLQHNFNAVHMLEQHVLELWGRLSNISTLKDTHMNYNRHWRIFSLSFYFIQQPSFCWIAILHSQSHVYIYIFIHSHRPTRKIYLTICQV